MERLLVIVALASLAVVVGVAIADVSVTFSPLGPLDGAVTLVGAR
jgi:hypothetical protein